MPNVHRFSCLQVLIYTTISRDNCSLPAVAPNMLTLNIAHALM